MMAAAEALVWLTLVPKNDILNQRGRNCHLAGDSKAETMETVANLHVS
jgi:hypothetical protein